MAVRILGPLHRPHVLRLSGTDKALGSAKYLDEVGLDVLYIPAASDGSRNFGGNSGRLK